MHYTFQEKLIRIREMSNTLDLIKKYDTPTAYSRDICDQIQQKLEELVRALQNKEKG